MTARSPLAIAIAANTLGLTAHTTYMYYLAPIALRNAGLTAHDSIIFSFVAVAMGLAVVPAGRLADRIPRRYVLRMGLALLGLAYGGVLLPGLASVVAGTVASGVGLAFLFVSFQSYVADLLRVEERAGAYGRAGALGVLATALGPFLAALVLRATPDDLSGLRMNALLFAAAAFAGVAITRLLPSTRAADHTLADRGRWSDAARAAGPIALLYLLMGAGYGMTAPYFTVYFLDEVGMANESWGYLLALGTLASACGSIAAGTLNRRLPAPPVALGGMTGLVLSSLVFLFPLPALALAIGFLGRSLFSTTVAPGASTVVMSRARAGRRAEAQAYASLAWNVGWAVGGGVGGLLLARIGGAIFPVGGTLALVGVAAASAILWRREPARVSPA